VETEGGRGGGRFFSIAGVWLAGLVALALIYQAATWPGQWGSWSFGEAALFLPGWCGLLIPAATFAGGLAVSEIAASRALFLKGALLAVVTYALLAYASPVADQRRMVSRGADPAVQYPFGPYTPGGLLKVREAVRANPPVAYSFRISRPLENPPNWWTYLLHSMMAVSGFTLLTALVGKEAGVVTRALPPPVRANVRWGLGLATMVAYFLAETLASSWVRSDPGASGVLAGWIALSVPLVELAILKVVARNQAAGLHAPASSGVR
jgi:hypothetical protein